MMIDGFIPWNNLPIYFLQFTVFYIHDISRNRPDSETPPLLNVKLMKILGLYIRMYIRAMNGLVFFYMHYGWDVHCVMIDSPVGQPVIS